MIHYPVPVVTSHQQYMDYFKSSAIEILFWWALDNALFIQTPAAGGVGSCPEWGGESQDPPAPLPGQAEGPP